MKIIRKIMLVLGWLVAMSALVFAVVGLDLRWNFSEWVPEFDMLALLQGLGILAVLAGMWFLAKTTRDRVSQIASAFVCLVLAGIAVVVVLPPERLTMERTSASPWWFRGGCTLLLCLPGAFWLWRLRPQADKSDQNPGPRWRILKAILAAFGLVLLARGLWLFVAPDEPPADVRDLVVAPLKLPDDQNACAFFMKAAALVTLVYRLLRDGSFRTSSRLISAQEAPKQYWFTVGVLPILHPVATSLLLNSFLFAHK